MSCKPDYHEYDTLSLVLKREALDIIHSYSRDFGWEVFKLDEDKRYFDIVHLCLVRPHKVSNKDKLQLLQFRMEGVINAIGDSRRKKHRRSILFGVLFALAVLGVSALAILSLLEKNVVFSIILPLCAMSLLLVGVVAVKRHIVRESAKYCTEYKAHTAKLIRILDGARRLVENEKQD